MRLAFDVGAEWEHLAAQMCWRRMARYRLGMGVLRWWDSLWFAVGQTLRSIHPIRATATVLRRLRWVTPRVSIGATSGVGGTLLLCSFLAVGIRMWGTENGSAKAGVMKPAIVTAAPAHEEQQLPASGSEAAVRTAPLASVPPRVDETTRRRVALTQAREKCMERIAETEQYRRAKAAFDGLDEKVRALRSDDPFRDLPKTSIEWIQAKSELKRVVDKAMTGDPAVQEAEEAVKALGNRKR